MKKEASIVFQINFEKFDDKGKERFFSLYRHLRKKRRLSRFCREAFIEKAGRRMNGLENSYQLLDSFIHSKGVQYILESIREKDAQLSLSSRNGTKEDDSPIVPVLLNPGEQPDPSDRDSNDPTANKPDIEKLKGLL